MKYLIPILIALCIGLLLGLSSDLVKEVSDLQARDRILSQEIIALRAYIEMVDDKADRIEKANMPFSHIIPIDGGFLGLWDGEEKDVHKD